MDTTPVSLLERVCKHWDQEDWVRFVRLYSPLIFNWGRRCGLQPADAAPISQRERGGLSPAARSD